MTTINADKASGQATVEQADKKLGKNARKRAARKAAEPAKQQLHSGMTGNGGRVAPNNGQPDLKKNRGSHHEKPAAPRKFVRGGLPSLGKRRK